MTNDNNDPPPENTYHLPLTPLSLPDDLAIQTLSRLTAKTLSPAHPAAGLKNLNDRFHAMMHAEGDQSMLLMRQSQTLDALFHLLLQHGIEADVPIHDLLALSLRSQKLCRDTVHTVNAIEYMNSVSTAINEKNRRPPPPFKIDPNELKDDENES